MVPTSYPLSWLYEKKKRRVGKRKEGGWEGRKERIGSEKGKKGKYKHGQGCREIGTSVHCW